MAVTLLSEVTATDFNKKIFENKGAIVKPILIINIGESRAGNSRITLYKLQIQEIHTKSDSSHFDLETNSNMVKMCQIMVSFHKSWDIKFWRNNESAICINA